MKRTLVAATALAASLLVLTLGATAAPQPNDVVCPQDTQAFSGAARNLIVPEDGFCEITNATIANDLVVQDGAGADTHGTSVGGDVTIGEDAEGDLSTTTVGHDVAASPDSAMHLELTTIGHDLTADEPQTVQTSRNGPDSPGGPVRVGHDVTIDGSPGGLFVFDALCSLTVGHDLRVTNRSVTLGIGIGGQCVAQGKQPNTVGHDLIVTGDTALVGFFGPSSLQVGSNQVGHDLVFTNNTAAPGGTLEVSGNTVGHDATCAANSPTATATSPNSAGRANTCG